MRCSILVTGGTGLVGQAIRKISPANAEWHFVGSQELDLAGEYATVSDWFALHCPTHVIHLAAKVGGLYKNVSEKLSMYQENMRINDNILRACAEHNVEKVVICLSTCVFPDQIEYPFVEWQLHNGPPHPSNEGYAYAKRMAEVQARLYNEANKNLQMMCVIPTNIYGPYDNFHLEDSHVVPGLIHRCYLAKQQNCDFVVRGTGKALRQFIHADDVAKLIVRTLFELQPKDIPHGVILAPQGEISIYDVALAIADAFEMPRDRVVWDSSYSDGQLRKAADNALLLRHFPDATFKDFRQGILETVQWFCKNYALARK